MIGITKSTYCLVRLPNSVVYEVETDPKADALECLQKVLDHLNIIEIDYFGLQYATKEGSMTWLNLRNPLDKQLTGPPPYRLHLRVKFFVQPHRILQTTTQHQFYLNIKQSYLAGEMHFISDSDAALMSAYIAQAEHNGGQPTYESVVPTDVSQHLVKAVAEEHSRLSVLRPSIAEYQLLQTAATHTTCYGVEFFQVALEPTTVCELYGNHSARQVKGQGQHHIGIGPEGVAIYSAKWKLRQSYAYPRVHRITVDYRCFTILIFNDDGTDLHLDFRLPSKAAASALYRCMTEMYCFYLCETVRDNVVSQFSRDLKGTLASLFNENSTVGKKYMFDIQRTANEAYDFYRRTLYKAGNDTAKPTVESSESCSAEISQSCQMKCQEGIWCPLCVDAQVSALFRPCRHLYCCTDCAKKVDTCPVCRQVIEEREPVFITNLPSREQKAYPVSRL